MSAVQIEESLFGKMSDKQHVKKYKMTNKNGFSVSLISYGASIQSIYVKDKTGQLINVSLGFETLEEYLSDSNPYFGATIGRVTNRIKNGHFKLNDESFNLEKNHGENILHGGPHGISKKNWASSIIDNYVKFTYVSVEGEGGFPGEVWFEAVYKLEENENKLSIEYKAITDKATPINMTSHFYLNLNGRDSCENIRNQLLKINADKYLELNSDNTVSGKILQTENTKYDFKSYTLLGDRIQQDVDWPQNGFDNYFVSTDSSSNLKELASAKNPSNGIRVDLHSNQLGLYFYSGNCLNLENLSHGSSYKKHHGFCLEAHNYPDSVNHESFPSCILNPDVEYNYLTTLTFSIDS